MCKAQACIEGKTVLLPGTYIVLDTCIYLHKPVTSEKVFPNISKCGKPTSYAEENSSLFAMGHLGDAADWEVHCMGLYFN